MQELRDDTFQQEVLESETPVIVDLLYAWLDPRVGHAPRALEKEERANLRGQPAAAEPAAEAVL